MILPLYLIQDIAVSKLLFISEKRILCYYVSHLSVVDINQWKFCTHIQTKIDVTPNSLIRTSIATFHNFLNTDNTILVKEVIQKLKVHHFLLLHIVYISCSNHSNAYYFSCNVRITSLWNQDSLLFNISYLLQCTFAFYFLWQLRDTFYFCFTATSYVAHQDVSASDHFVHYTAASHIASNRIAMQYALAINCFNKYKLIFILVATS